MIKTPLSDKNDLATVSITLDGAPLKDVYQVMRVEIDKAVNTIAAASIVLLDGDPAAGDFEASASTDFVPGKKVEINLGYHAVNELVFKGVIVAQEIKVRSRANRLLSQLTIRCADEAQKLTVTRKFKYFKDKKDSDIISSVLSDAGVSKKVDATDYQHNKMVQYDCTDWDFIISRAEVNGMVVLCQDGMVSVVKPALSESAVLAVTYGYDVIDFYGELDATHQVDSVSCVGWDGTQLKTASGVSAEPSVNAQGDITGKKLSEVLSPGVYEMHSTIPEDPSVLKAWANARLQQVRMARLRGYVSFPGHAVPQLGKLISLNGFGTRFNGDAYISGIQHVLDGGLWITKVSFGLAVQSFSETHAVTSPPAMGILPGIQGLQIGTVKQIDEDPDGEYRVLVDVPMVEASGVGVWARLTHEYASADIGFYFYPEVGDEVVLGFLNEDPRFPVIVGALYGKKNKPAYTPEKKNNTKAIVTKSKMKIVFDEERKSISLETPGGNKMVMSDDAKSVTIEDQNKNKVTLSSDGIVLDSPKDIVVKSKGKFSVDAMNVAISSKGDVAIEGNNVNAKAKIAFLAQGSAQAALKASGQVEVKGAMVMIN